MTEPRVYRASSLGYSLEALVAPHLGYLPVDPPEFMAKAFAEGNRIEPLAIERLREMGWLILTTQPELNAVGDYQIEVELEVIPGIAKVVGHLDGQISYGCGTPAILEVKSMAHKSFLGWKKCAWKTPGLIQKYKWQASALMLAEEMPHCLVAWDKETEELSWVTVTEPFYTISDIANKLQLAEDFIAKGVVPDGCEDFPCPFYYLHPPKDEVEKADSNLDELLESWLIWDKAEKQAKSEKDDLRKEIFALAGDQAAAKVRGECGVTVETYWQNESTYTTTKREGWVSRISGPRKPKNG